VAKKRKGARPTKKASRSVKKKAVKKAASSKPKQLTGYEKPGFVNFNPLKQQMSDHIAALESAKVPNEKIANALRILRQAKADLTIECLPTMELQTS
jgi:hypothetical protein